MSFVARWTLTFERRDGRLPFTTGRDVFACTVTDETDPETGARELGGSELTVQDLTWNAYPELIEVYLEQAAAIAVRDVADQAGRSRKQKTERQP